MCGARTSISIPRMLFQVVLIMPMSSVHYLITYQLFNGPRNGVNTMIDSGALRNAKMGEFL